MSETKHTPGPWKWRHITGNKYHDLIGPDSLGNPGVLLARVIGTHWCVTDMRLIAAAPDLLAAAKSANAMLAEIVSEHSDDFYPEETSAIIDRVKQIYAAIAKAQSARDGLEALLDAVNEKLVPLYADRVNEGDATVERFERESAEAALAGLTDAERAEALANYEAAGAEESI